MEKTASLLFEYLRDILLHPDSASLDLSQLLPQFRKLGEGLQFLQQCVREQQEFALAMARGDLSLPPPSPENTLAAPVAELQASLRHLAWQTQQVAKGDYNQSVDFMGEFSESFNTMTAQLRERTESLLAGKKKVEEKNLELEQNLALIQALIKYTHHMMFVFSATDGRMIFANKPAEWFLEINPALSVQLTGTLSQKKVEDASKSIWWEAELSGPEGEPAFYEIESFSITWQDEQAVAHIATDDTERRRKENLIYRLAYVDPLTGLNNRRYAMDLMEKWIEEKRAFCVSFIDIDYLKYCNDTFGHKMGDQYLIQVSQMLQTTLCEVCRISGDEFLLLSPRWSAAEQDERLEKMRRILLSDQQTPYPKSFSFASVEVPVDPPSPLAAYLHTADKEMYIYKQEHKKKLDDVLYNDSRTPPPVGNSPLGDPPVGDPPLGGGQ